MNYELKFKTDAFVLEIRGSANACLRKLAVLTNNIQPGQRYSYELLVDGVPVNQGQK